MRMSEKCRNNNNTKHNNNNSNNPLTSRRTDGGKTCICLSAWQPLNEAMLFFQEFGNPFSIHQSVQGQPK